MILSVDVGGTKILVALFDKNGKIVGSEKVKTPNDNYQYFLEILKDTIHEVSGSHKITACSIAMPGKIDRKTGTALAFGNLPWKNIEIANDLTDTVSCPIFVENDANLAGLAEATEIINQYKKTLYITISTGIGGVLVVNGKMDKDTIDAEIGHTLHEHEGQLMRWEEFASGKAIVARTGKMAKDLTEEKDWYIVARNIAIGLINMIASYTPDCVVIGGGVGTHLDKFIGKLQEELEIYKDDLITLPVIQKAKNPEQAVVYGGYLLAMQKLGHHGSN